jgi:hypothetical protein
MDANLFKYYFRTSPSEYYYINNQNTVGITSQKRDVESCVMNWKETEFEQLRSDKYWGAFQEMSLSLDLVLGGAKIARYFFYTYGVHAVCNFYIEKFNSTTQQYEPWNEVHLDFSEFIDEKDIVNLKMKDRGAPTLLKSREDVPYEIPLLTSDIPIQVDGIKVQSYVKWSPASFFSPFVAIVPGFAEMERGSALGGWLTPSAVAPWSINENTDHESDHYFFKATATDQYTITIKNLRVRHQWTIGSEVYTVQIKLRGFDLANNITTDVMIGTYPVGGEVNLILPTITYSGIPQISERFILYFDWTSLNIGDVENPNISLENASDNSNDDMFAEVRLDYLFNIPPNDFKGIRCIELFKRLIDKISDGQYIGESTFLSTNNTTTAYRKANWDNLPYYTMMTSGDGIRGLPNAVIKTSLNEFFQFCWSEWNLALSIEGNVIRLEPLDYFLTSNILLDLPEVNNFNIYPMKDKMFNRVKVGYNSDGKSYNQTDGKDEFNTVSNFLLEKVTLINREDDITNDYITAMWAFESVRSETVSQENKDNQFDNNTFVIEVNPIPVSGKYIPFRDGYVTGVASPATAYNIGLSPARMFGRNLRRIRSLTSFLNKGFARFQTSEKNQDLVSNLTGGPFSENIIEKGDINLDSNPNRGRNTDVLFQPVIFEFDCSAAINMPQIVTFSSRGCMTFPYRGHIWKGFIMEVGMFPATRDKYRFKLLSHPDNDLSKLY